MTARSANSGLAAVEKGNELTQQTRSAYEENTTIAGKVAQLVDEIAHGSNEQVSGIEQINAAIAEINTVIQKNASSSEESAAAAEEMNAQATQMETFVADLTALAGTGGDGNGNGHRKPVFFKKRQSLPPVAEKTSKDGMKPAMPVREVTAKQLIPLDEGDFSDF